MRGPRLEFAVGAFLLLAMASLLVLAIASTNGKFGFAGDSYPVTARFSSIGQLRASAPVKIGGVVVGQVADIALDPVKFDSVVTLAIDSRYKDLPADTSTGAFSPPGVPPPLNMYLPTSCIRSTAAWVITISSPGFNTSVSPPGLRPTKLSPSKPLVKMPAEVSAGRSW